MIASILRPFEKPSYAAMRIVVGLLFAFHGAQKIFGVFSDGTPPIGSQIWIGGVIELVGGLMISVGFLSSIAAFIASGTMAVAYVQFHWKFQLGSGFFPAMNKGELAVVYAFLFLFIACRGPGMWSLGRRKG